MPVMNGIQATEKITTDNQDACVLIMSAEGTQDYLRQAMVAGARDYLVKPFTSDELVMAIKRAWERELARRSKEGGARSSRAAIPSRIFAVYSPHDGAGKTTIATNLAVCCARDLRLQSSLVDLTLQFGDVDLMLNLEPANSLEDLLSQADTMDLPLLERCMVTHNSGLRVLAAPLRPHYSEAITAYSVETLFRLLRHTYEVVVVDADSNLNDTTLVALDSSDVILLVLTLDLPSIRNGKRTLEVMRSLHYPEEKIKLVLNRADSRMGVTAEEVADALEHPVLSHIPSDGRVVVTATNTGQPFVATEPTSRCALAVKSLARELLGAHVPEVAPSKASEPTGMRGLIQNLLRAR
jgi:pilus assembly protein CpaE